MRIPTKAWSLGRIGARLGVILGVLYSFDGLAADLHVTGPAVGTAIALVMLAAMPVLFGAAGLLVGAAISRRTDEAH